MKVHLRNPDRTVELPGPAAVREVLSRLEVNPETVLVIHDGTLVTKDHVVGDDAEIELRPVISGGAGPARCHACRRPAVLEVARHRCAYCAEHVVDHVRAQVRAAIDRYRMMSYGDRVLVAVSGGKDSLALWDVLLDMGYRADGLYVGLGIGAYSTRSAELVRGFAERRGAKLHPVDLADDFGFDIPQAATARERSSCGVCGLSKRYVFNRGALQHGYDVMATGHNLDDEAATLLANVLRWQTPFMARQSPLLPAAGSGLAKKVKPLYRLGEREMAAYCVVKGLDYVVEECPMVAGNTVLRHKDALNELERHSPGTKAQFLFGFLDRVREAHFSDADGDGQALVVCADCGMPTTARAGAARPSAGGDTVRADGPEPARCAFCRTRGRVLRVMQPRSEQASA
ncbi:MAG: tRNA(Ile)-lysidine synthetase [Actinomycetota bacterium]|nr:tRNA(Ile)-lysidine synthetase [Actinomycetota bacterium]